MLAKILKTRGIHFILTRFGPEKLKRLAFDEKYRGGEWDFANDGPAEMVELVKRYAKNGKILLLGCGSAALLKDLPRNSFETLLGVDLSPEAIKIAERQMGPNVRFQQGDMMRLEFPDKYQLILFSESMYYVPALQRKSYLCKMCRFLAPGGAIVVTIAESTRYESIFELIHKQFKILEDRHFPDSSRRYIAFASL